MQTIQVQSDVVVGERNVAETRWTFYSPPGEELSLSSKAFRRPVRSTSSQTEKVVEEMIDSIDGLKGSIYL